MHVVSMTINACPHFVSHPHPALPTRHHPLATSPPTHHVKYVNVTFLFFIYFLFCETRAEEDVDDVIEENYLFIYLFEVCETNTKKRNL